VRIYRASILALALLIVSSTSLGQTSDTQVRWQFETRG
jgi:hypothetical protein